MPDLYKNYLEKVHPALKEKRGYKNVMSVPHLSKILLSTGISTNTDRDAFPEAKQILTSITGQAAVITKARTNIANFKLRKGMSVGVMVTLRRHRMYEFLDRFIHIVLPRVRDFRGIPNKGFDGKGNYNMGLKDISVFTEVDLDKLKHPIGINITFVTTARTDEEALDLLRMLELPFAE